MMTLEQACEIVLKEEHAKYIASVQELPEMFVIDILGNDGQELLHPGCTVHKESGRFGIYTPPLRLKTFRELKKLEVPEKYRFPLTITLEQACEIVLKEKNAKYIASVQELPEMFVIVILGDDGQGLLDSAYTVNKKTGNFGVYDIMLRFRTHHELKKLEVPEKYRFPDET